MFAPFPEAARIEVAPALARDLLMAAKRLPRHDHREFYAPAVQSQILGAVRGACPDDFDRLVQQINGRIARRPYCALVCGLRFDEGHNLFIALNRAFGELVAPPYREPRARLVHYVEPATDIASSRGGHESERLHTDTADWREPVELISMVCVRADHAGGGRSRVLDIDSVRDEVQNCLGQATLELLETEPVPWQLADYNGGGVARRTVLSESKMRWRRYTIDLALSAAGDSLSPDMLAAVNAFETLVASTTRTIDFLMREGELLLTDNARTIHARTPIADGRASERLMLRSWIKISRTE